MRRRAGLLAVIALAGAACSTSPGVATSTAPPTTDASTTIPASSSTTTTTAATTTTTTTTPPADVRALAHSVLLIGLPGPELDEATAARLSAGAAGLILFSLNIENAGQLRALTAAAACAATRPILVAVDQELGPVARLAGLVTPLPSPADVADWSPAEMELTGQLLGQEMLSLGVNVNLAPVLDVVTGPNPVLADRHLGPDPELVAELGTAFLRGLQQAGVVAVPKHFPGHGRSTTDPHGEVTRIDASLEDLAATDFLPFRTAIASGARAVMVGHPIYEAIDPALPASLSPAVLALLRNEFGFDGVAITDSLSMVGVTSGRDPGEVAVAALAAGEDLLLVVDPARVDETVAAIVAALATGALDLGRLEEAAARVGRLAVTATAIGCPG